jgi:uncharacterized protein (TIGR03435 family)
MRLPRFVTTLTLAAGLGAQSQNATGTLQFDVASVKPGSSAPAPTRFIGGPGTADPNRISWENVDLRRLLMRAYAVETDQISGPGWIDSEKYSIAANVPSGATSDQFRIMLRNLLTERFGLVLHHDVKEFTVYELTVAKGGPKLTSAAPPDPNVPAPTRDFGPPSMELDKEGCPIAHPGTQSGSGRFGPGISCSRFVKQSVPNLIKSLETFVAAEEGLMFDPSNAVHIVDKTGLTGEYDFTLKFQFMPRFPGQMATAGQASDPNGDDGPTIFTALDQQLGLKLQKVKQTLDRIVIDQADKIPAAN